jgi:hypothetical protein
MRGGSLKSAGLEDGESNGLFDHPQAALEAATLNRTYGGHASAVNRGGGRAVKKEYLDRIQTLAVRLIRRLGNGDGA